MDRPGEGGSELGLHAKVLFANVKHIFAWRCLVRAGGAGVWRSPTWRAFLLASVGEAGGGERERERERVKGREGGREREVARRGKVVRYHT